MTLTMDDLYPPLKGHADVRPLMLHAMNNGLDWEYRGEVNDGLWTAHIRLGDDWFKADAGTEQDAVDAATDAALAGRASRA